MDKIIVKANLQPTGVLPKTGQDVETSATNRY
jgi:hypothetical protein